jgi:hypothetical protein
MFWGPPDKASGRPRNCISAIHDGGDLVFKAHYGSSPGVPAVKIDRNRQAIAIAARSGYWGTLDHFSTGNRRWTFPDSDGTVLVIKQHDALGFGAVPTLHSIGGSGPTIANQDSWARVVFDGTTFWIPLWR